MSYRRAIAPERTLHGEELTAALVGIGINLAAAPATDPNIEDVAMAASTEGLEEDDLRVLSLLVTWLSIHAARLNADRLAHLVLEHPSARVRAFWSAVGRWLEKDRRLRRLVKAYGGRRLDLLRVGTEFQVRRFGEDARFAGTRLRVPANVLRDRPGDILSPAELARRHRAYRMRIMLGPSFRADMWAALEAEPALSAAELARRAYGSFATAWQVRQDWGLLASNHS